MDTVTVRAEGEGRDRKLVFEPSSKATPALAGAGGAGTVPGLVT